MQKCWILRQLQISWTPFGSWPVVTSLVAEFKRQLWWPALLQVCEVQLEGSHTSIYPHHTRTRSSPACVLAFLLPPIVCLSGDRRVVLSVQGCRCLPMTDIPVFTVMCALHWLHIPHAEKYSVCSDSVGLDGI